MTPEWKYLPSPYKIQVTAATVRTGIDKALRDIPHWNVCIPGRHFQFGSWQEAIQFATAYERERVDR